MSFFRFVLKSDDDIFVDIFALMQKVKDVYGDLEGKLLGYKQMGLRPERDERR